MKKVFVIVMNYGVEGYRPPVVGFNTKEEAEIFLNALKEAGASSMLEIWEVNVYTIGQ